jgi:uncharacterized delta-60 repeat protein
MVFEWWRNRNERQLRPAASKRGRRYASGKKTNSLSGLERLEDRCVPNAGTLDPAFGAAGIVQQAAFAYHASDVNNTGFHSVAVQADGRIVVAGAASGAPAGVFTLSRFNTDGSPDSAFNATVIATTGKFSAGSTDSADAAAIQADGKIVVAGATVIGGIGHFAVSRYNPDGSLDTTFGNGGHVIVIFSTDTLATKVSSVAIEGDGRILVGGTSGSNFALARMNSDGTQDSDFDADGKVEMNIGATLSNGAFTSTDVLTDIGVGPDNKIYTVGWTNIENDGKQLDLTDNFGVARFNQDGTLDLSFRGTGVVSDDLFLSPYNIKGQSPFQDKAFSVAFQLDGKILVAGMSQAQVNGVGTGAGGNQSSDNFALVRYNTDGSFDRTFTADGVVITDFATDFTTGSQDQANSVNVEADGKIVLAGFTFTNPGGGLGTSEHFAMARYNTNGTLDQNFGVHGKSVTDVSGNGTDNVANQEIQLTNGQLIVVGATGDNPNAHLTLARYVGIQPGVIQFSAASFSVSENAGIATISVTRVGGTDGTATVNYSTTSGTAVAGTDYTPTTGTLTFFPGQSSLTFTVPVRDDGVFQAFNKQLFLTLTNVTGGPSLGTPSTAKLILVEADTTSSTGGNGTGGGGGGGGGGGQPPSNNLFITQVYHDLLGRAPDAAGLANWLNFLNRGGTRAQLAFDIESSPEYRTDEVQALYQRYLHRAADASGLANFTNFLAGGGTVEQVATALVGSPEYFQNRAGGTALGFLQVLYSDALGRALDAGGQAFFLQAMANGATTSQVAATMFRSTEYLQDLVNSWYVEFLRRPADTAGLNGFVGELQQGSGTQPIFTPNQNTLTTDQIVIALIIGSQEYYNRL